MTGAHATQVGRVLVDVDYLAPLIPGEWVVDQELFEQFRMMLLASLRETRDLLSEQIDRLEYEQEWEEQVNEFDY